ncbi:archaeal proteasome endopeptidase complex subunit beta [Halomarina oriensis]|uniref:Proteasome subunit beta n=1 Tax=Halomarina oriensis TaxID=671145 RepID=A0A6B0GN80_9EURY|nr:archaeal proteasome endopeptidase complex subunit beta [Halomarina oriensis]MWG36386.1 archaeal proteasome endopeptidase complex subunit beta [Halomarina oriensis]
MRNISDSDVGSLRTGRPDVTESELVEQQRTETHDQEDLEALKTGTTTIGVRTEDGVVLVTDRRASLGRMVSSKTVQKVENITDFSAITISGSVSAAQNLIRTLRAETSLYETRRGQDISMTGLSTLLSNFLRSGAYFIVVPLLGGYDDEGPHLFSYDALGGVTEEEYAVSGSGSQFALGVLEQQYEEGMSLDDAESAAIAAVLSAVERDTASGNGVHVARITEEGTDITEFDSIDAVRQYQ